MRIFINKKTKQVELGYTEELPINNQWAIVCKLGIEKLRDCDIARPLGCLGTCGFSPFSWECGIGDNPTKAAKDFVFKNTKAIQNNF
jgi:hypothetical protein